MDESSFDDSSNFYTWLARNSQAGNIVDGGTIVMLSTMLKGNISVTGVDQMWNYQDAAMDLGLMYLGGNKFVPTEVSSTYEITVIVPDLLNSMFNFDMQAHLLFS